MVQFCRSFLPACRVFLTACVVASAAIPSARANTAPIVSLEVAGAAHPVTLAWDPNPEPDVVGYKVYAKTSPSGNFTMLKAVDLITTANVEVSEGNEYYFVVTAINSVGLESLPSEEVFFDGAARSVGPASFTLNAIATDLDGSVVRVEFYLGEQLIGQDLEGPFTFTWESVAPGTHSVTARAYDDDGAFTETEPFELSVVASGVPNTWADWRAAFASAVASDDEPGGNADGDLYDNLLEYALLLNPGSGSTKLAVESTRKGGFWLEYTDDFTIDAVFVRPSGGLTDVTYSLEVADALGSPTNWRNANTTVAPYVTDNGDGTETVRFSELQSIDGGKSKDGGKNKGLNLGNGTGFARLRVDLDDSVTTATSYTQVYGWSLRPSQLEGETCSVPFLQSEVFSGKVTAFVRGVLDVSSSAGTGEEGVGAQMSDRPHYIELISGAFEGHRFEVAFASDQSITLNQASPHNTLDPVPDLTGSSFTLHPHHTLG